MDMLLIDDHEVVRDGIKALIEQECGWHVAISAASVSSIKAHPNLENIDIAIIDISLQQESGLDGLSYLKEHYPYIRCLMLSMYDHVGFITKALEQGADGYVTKTSASQELTLALEELSKGRNYLSSDLSNKLAFQHHSKVNSLTQREREVFLYLAKGFAPKRISHILDTMPKTIMVHRTNIYKKLGVTSQFELLRLALSEGMLDLNDFIHAKIDKNTIDPM